MSNVMQDAQQLFTEFLAKMFTNQTFAAQAVGNLPAALQAEGIPESALPYLNVQQAVTDACGYPGVPPSAAPAITPSYTAPPPPPHNYTELVQQMQVVNNFVSTEIIDNSTETNIGANFGTIDVSTDNDVTQVGGDNEGAIGENNEVAHLDIDASGGSGGPATGGDASAQGGTATGGTSSADGGSGGYGGAGGQGGDGYGTGSTDPYATTYDEYGDQPGGDGGDGGYGGPGGPGGYSDSSASADAYGGTGGDATSEGGDGGVVIPVIIFGDDVQEAGPGDLNQGARYAQDDNDDPGAYLQQAQSLTSDEGAESSL